MSMPVQIMSLIITSKVIYLLKLLKMMSVFNIVFFNVIALANAFCALDNMCIRQPK